MTDLGTIDALARLQLAARRLGLDVRLRDVSPELCELIDFVGLADVLRVVRFACRAGYVSVERYAPVPNPFDG